MSARIRVLHYGLGPIGVRIAQLAASRPALLSIGAVDIDPAQVGRDLGDVANIGHPIGVTVQKDLGAALRKDRPDIVVHATGSFLDTVLPQFVSLASAGLSVVSTCEELSYPWFHHTEEAQKIDDTARRNRVAVLGTGINPGFIMDALPLILSGVCPDIAGVRVRRVVDLSIRRQQLQAKVGVNLTAEQFTDRKAAGRLGHVGLPESVAMIAAGLGWKLDRVDQSLEPVLAPHALDSALGRVAKGRVQGQHQVAHGWVDDRERITMELTMALHAPDAGDFVNLEGLEPVSSVIRGVQGDIATAAIVVNSIQHVMTLAPGLHTMLDLPPLGSVGD